MISRTRFILSLLCLLVAASARAETRLPPAEHVFIISIDGGKPSVMRESRMPNLQRMVSEGAVSWEAQTIYPSITLVSHTSMLTGVEPATHRVMWNDWIPRRGLVRVPTVFSLAKERGLRTALFAGKSKFRHLNVPETLDRFAIPGYSAKKVAAAAAKYIEAQRPNLCFIHFADPDGAGHSKGWGTEAQKKAFADVDTALGVVRSAIEKAGIADRSVVIISADHGGHAKTHGTRMPEDMTIPWIAWGANVRPGTMLRDRITTYDTAATALWLLDVSVPVRWDGRPVERAFDLSAFDVRDGGRLFFPARPK
jgi:predicted AlkP superfamily pyrophosphatase or phosphodiesterase